MFTTTAPVGATGEGAALVGEKLGAFVGTVLEGVAVGMYVGLADGGTVGVADVGAVVGLKEGTGVVGEEVDTIVLVGAKILGCSDGTLVEGSAEIDGVKEGLRVEEGLAVGLRDTPSDGLTSKEVGKDVGCCGLVDGDCDGPAEGLRLRRPSFQRLRRDEEAIT